jgi:hypothetical protein
MKLDTKNVFDSLCARLVLDVLSGKASRDYGCAIKVDEDFETVVHELRTYFGFLSHSIQKYVTLHVWGRSVKSLNKTVFKLDVNLDFSMGKTEFLGKEPVTRHVYERTQYSLQTDPDLQDIANDFTPEMYTVKDIEVLGTTLGTNVYIRDFVSQNCIKIMRDMEKLESLTDGFTHFQLVQKTMNTHTQYTTVYITLTPQEQFLTAQHLHVDTKFANERYSRFFPSVDGDYVPKASLSRWFWFDSECHHTNYYQGRYGISIPGIGRIFTPRGTKLWIQNQLTHDPDSWTDPHLLNLELGYDVLVNKYGYKVQDMYTVQDHPPPPTDFLLLSPLDNLYKDHVRNQVLPHPGDFRPVMSPSQNTLSKQMMKKWETWELNLQKTNNSRMIQ